MNPNTYTFTNAAGRAITRQLEQGVNIEDASADTLSFGTTGSTEASADFVSDDGTRLTLEVSAVPLMGGERVVGVFGLLTGPFEAEPTSPPAH